MQQTAFPRLAYNWITALGAILAAVSAATLSALLIMILFFEEEVSPYFGIFLYIVLPGILVVGLILIPLGMWLRRRKVRKLGETYLRKWPVVDFNQASFRNAAILFVTGTTLVVALTSVGTYKAYHFSESVDFCGSTCHPVMEPEYTTYQSSPHARVPCAECHIGSGAGWFVKSKLSGSYQVYATLAGIYPRPIPTPIESLRPAQETCETCHWPEQTFGAQQRQFNHYMYDEANTHWPINMLVKTGGGDPRTGQTSGIHWHMNIGLKVEYIPRDERRQEIPWVRVTDRRTGRVTVYQDQTNQLSEEEIAAAQPRVMDCMDCHNRPSHIFRSPDYAVDHALQVGSIDPELPGVKRIAVEAMTREYESKDEALQQIANRMTDAYRTEHLEIFQSRQVEVENAVLATQGAYSQNFFPSMEVTWSRYPDNIGHFINPGCMRCHAGNHVSEDGVTVTRSCTTCHIILSQGSGERAQVADTPEGLEFSHPEDIGEAWREIGCYECHTGVQP